MNSSLWRLKTDNSRDVGPSGDLVLTPWKYIVGRVKSCFDPHPKHVTLFHSKLLLDNSTSKTKDLCQKWKVKLNFRGDYTLQAVRNRDCWAFVNHWRIGCNLKRFDGLTWLTLTPIFYYRSTPLDNTTMMRWRASGTLQIRAATAGNVRPYQRPEQYVDVSLSSEQWLKWSCSCEAGGLTWRSQVGVNPIPIPHPTNLALFWHKITLYRFNQGGSYYCRGGLKSEQGAGPPGPLTLTTGFEVLT